MHWLFSAGVGVTTFRSNDLHIHLHIKRYLHLYNPYNKPNLVGDDAVTTFRSRDKRLYLHFSKANNNQTWQNGSLVCTNLQVMVTSLPLGSVTIVYGFIFIFISLQHLNLARWEISMLWLYGDVDVMTTTNSLDQHSSAVLLVWL